MTTNQLAKLPLDRRIEKDAGDGLATQGSTQKAFLRDAITYLPTMLLPALTGFISVPILTRLFRPHEYGELALAEGITDLLLAIGIMSIGASVIRFFPAYKVKSELERFFAALLVTVGLLVLGLVGLSLLMLLQIEQSVSPTIYKLMLLSSFVFVVQGPLRVFMAVLRAQLRSGIYTIFELVTRYGSLGLGIFLVVVIGLQIEGLLWASLIVYALALPVLFWVVTRGIRVRLRSVRLSDGMQIWKYAWPLAIGNVAIWGLRLSDRYILGLYRTTEEVGFYSVGYNISARTIEMLVLLLLFSMGPRIMNIWESRGSEATSRALQTLARVFLLICIPACVGITVLAFPFISVLTDEAYHEGHRIVGFVAFSSLLWGFSQIASMGTLIKKRTRTIAANQAIAAAVNLGLNLLLIERFGFIAAGFTTLLGYCVLVILQAVASRPHLKWSFPVVTLRNAIIASGIMALTVFLVSRISLEASRANFGYLLITVLLGAIVYGVALALLGEMTDEERLGARLIVNNLASRVGGSG